MKSERLLRAGWVLVAVRATAAFFAPGAGFPSCLARNVLGSRLYGPRRRAPQAQPEHDRLRPGARLRRAAGPRPDASRARPRRALGRREGVVQALWPCLADLRGRPPG